MFNKKNIVKTISTLIATILLIVIAVGLISLLFTWGKDFVDSSLDETKTIFREDTSIIGFFNSTYTSDGIVRIRNNSNKSITIKKYQIVSELDESYDLVNAVIPLKEPIDVSIGRTLILPLICKPSDSFNVNLITDEDRFVSITLRNINNYDKDSCKKELVGSGLEEDPYRIYNVFQLNDMRNYLGEEYENTNFSLERNIDFDWFDLSYFSHIEGFGDYDTNGWSPIGYDGHSDFFQGNFDGKNNVIRNLYIYRPTQDRIGLFGYSGQHNINNNLKNIGLEDVNITGNRYVGALIGFSNGSKIFNSFSSGSVSGIGDVGGLIGSNYGVIMDSYFIGNVSGLDFVGGLVGDAGSGVGSNISNCYFTGTVSGDNRVGGLIGFAAGIIENNYSKGFVSGTNNVGGLIGSTTDDMETIYINKNYSACEITGETFVGGLIGHQIDPQQIIINNSYWDKEVSGQDESDGGIGKTTEQMKQQATFINWDFNTIWKIDEGKSYPYFRDESEIIDVYEEYFYLEPFRREQYYFSFEEHCNSGCEMELLEVKQQHWHGGWESRIFTDAYENDFVNLPYGLFFEDNTIFHPEHVYNTESKIISQERFERGPQTYKFKFKINRNGLIDYETWILQVDTTI